ncbi:S-layer homology domain-containing protein [Paenibacillus sp. FA6]|uniref:S-layer homology domain-containing protein n=1 Tax=Paenibacillus sp. FA6 TaxID=3413029 RepID=UPI003F654C9C
MNRRSKVRRSVSILMLSSMMLSAWTPAGFAAGTDGMKPIMVPAPTSFEIKNEAFTPAQKTQEVGLQQLQIQHSPANIIPEHQDLTVTAVIYGDIQPWIGHIQYSIDGKFETSIPLTQQGTQADTYTATIPGAVISGNELKYTITARDEQSKLIQSTTYSIVIRSNQAKATVSSVPSLLITEMVPDTNNISGADAYEFVEVYNNTDQDVDFKDYSFFYNGKDTWTPVDNKDMIIPAHSPVVFWIMNGSNNQLLSDGFNQNYVGSALVEGKDLFRINGGAGMANGSPRSLVIKDSSGNTVVTAAYEAAHVKVNQGIFFKHPAAGSTNMVVMSHSGQQPATPGLTDPEQLKPVIIDQGNTIEITHTPAASVDVNDLEVAAHVVNPVVNPDGSKPPVLLLYKTPTQTKYTSATMVDPKGTGDYTATIPASVFTEASLDYRIQVQTTEKAYSTQVNMPPFDSTRAPALLITELVPNTTNVPTTSSDAFEFVEVYNNTDQTLNFKNYKLYYRYPDKGVASDVVWPTTKESFEIPSKQSVVLWIKNSVNTSYTTNDFNTFHNTNLIEDQTLFAVPSDGMANSGRRAIVIKTNTGKEISAAYYDADTSYEGGTKDDTKEDKSLVYAYPVNGSTVMIKMNSGVQAPTPGSVTNAQVPVVPVHVEKDDVPPTIQDLTGVQEIDQANSLELKADAKDNRAVTSVEVYVRSDKQASFVSYNLSEDFNDTMYHFKVSSADLIGRSYIEYYFVVSDGMNETKSNVMKVNITGGPDQSPLRLNVKDNDMIKGIHTIKGTAQVPGANALSLSIDGQFLPETDLYSELENDAYFVFDATNVDYYFKNAVTMGPSDQEDKTILYTFMDPITSYTTLSFPISADRLKVGNDNVIYVRAGSKTSPFDNRPEENKDDFEIKNVRLLLADGTEIWDVAYAERDKQIKMGDSVGKSESIGFQFDLKADQLNAKAYSWNTTTVEDGPHQITVASGTNEIISNVIVDNTAPTIKPSVEEGKEYRGVITLDAIIHDNYAGVDTSEVRLDDQIIELPFTTSSGKLAGGAHKLYIEATDKVGNVAEVNVNFTVPDENPLEPQLISPTHGQNDVGSSANLTVKVQDPTNDLLDVLFYKGFKYDGNRAEGFTGYTNASVTEPPKEMIPAGEQAFSPDDYKKISAVDGEYLVNDSVDKFPYQRFEVKLDPSVKGTDRIEVNWRGKSLEGRKVSLYAWSPSMLKWIQLDHVIAGTEDFELQAVVKAGEYASGQIIEVMVQDEIAIQAATTATTNKPTPETQDEYDFSFVWMSDTQYYSQSYPKIYQNIVSWIADQKEKMNIKYVIHTGDVVDKSYQEYQWIEADKNMKVLEDAQIPYGVLAGNHDVGHQDNDYTKFQEYFGEERFKNNSTFAGSYENNRGHYDLVSSNGNDFIIVYMGWGLGDKEIDWMNEIVAKYPERKAILSLHEYMLVSNNRAPIADKIFEKVVKPNKNVFATLSGHYHDAQLKVDELDDNGDGVADRKVFQMLADYQGAAEGGLGYIRLMQFDMKNNKLHMKTYSPHLDDYNFYDPLTNPNKDEFSLDLDLQPKTKRVATDYISVKVYTDELIGSNSNVQSGSQTTVNWVNLSANSYQQWYTKVEDQNSGSTLSDIWGFYTGATSDEEHPEIPEGGGNSGGENDSSDLGAGVSPIPVPPTIGTAQSDIMLTVSADGTYKADQAVLDKAITSAVNGRIVITLNNKTAQTIAPAVYLPAASVQKAKDNNLSIIIVAPEWTVTLSAASLPGHLNDADLLVLRIDTSMNTSIQSAISQSIGSSKEYTLSDLVYTLSMVKLKGQTETEIHELTGPVTVERTWTLEQKNTIDTDYAGVYYLNGLKPEYMGGIFNSNTVTFTTNHFSSFAVLEYHKQFADVNGSWADEYIGKLTAKHIINGIDENHYGPKLDLMRADFVTLVVRALELDKKATEGSFSDVPANAYYADSVAQAANLGLIQGNGGKFRPKDTISREEAAMILMKMSDYMKLSSGGSSFPAFADMRLVSGWAKEAVSQVNELGLMNGKGNHEFDPQGSVTRAEIAKILYVLLNK